MLRTCLGIIAGWCLALSLNAQNTFQKTYGGTEDDFGADLVITPDGYVIAGSTFSVGSGGRDAFLLKIGPSGNVIWQRNYGSFDADQFTQVTLGNDGGYLAAGSTFSAGAGGQDFWLVKTDDLGVVQWSKTIGGDLNESSDIQGKILRVEDGYVVSFTQLSTAPASGQQTCIARIDNAGNIVWEKTYQSQVFNIFGVTDIAAQGQVLYAGGGADGEACLLALDPANGSVISARWFAGAGNESLYNVFVLPDTSLILSDGTWTPSGSQFQSHWLMKTGQNGLVKWSKVYSQANGAGLRGVAIPTPDGGFLSTPYNTPLTISSDANMIKLDGSGNVQWAHCFGGDHADQFIKGYATADGGYIAVGQTENTGKGATDILVVKVNADGLVEGCCKKDLNLEVADYFPPINDQGFGEDGFFPPQDAQLEMISSLPTAGDFCSNVQPVQHDTVALCPGEAYNLGGTEFFAPDEVTTLIPGPGCDTVLVTHLILRQYVIADFGVQYFCPGGFVTINGVNYDQPGNLLDTLTNHNGLFCDTIGSYTIVQLDNPTFTQTIGFCPGQSVVIGGQSYDEPGVVVDTLPSTTGCDTIATYILEQLNQVTLYDGVIFCPGDTIFINGQGYTEEGIVYYSIPSSNGGCDTLVEVTLQLAPQDFVVTLLDYVCVNGSPVIDYEVCNLTGGPVPDNLWVSFYYNNPFETNAVNLGTYATNAFDTCLNANTSVLPFSVADGGTIYAVVNDDGGVSTPYSLDDFPIYYLTECNYANNLASIVIQSVPGPAPDLGPDVTLCKDSTVLFNAGYDYDSYLWQDGSTGQFFATDQFGTYWVEVTDECGFKQRDTVLLLGNLLPDTKFPDQSICPGASVTLPLPGFDSYAWAPATGLSCTDCSEVTIQPDATTTYTVDAFSNLGCELHDTFTINILPLPARSETIEFCPGESVVIDGQSYTQSGSVIDTIPSNTAACDTVVTYTLVLLPQPERSELIAFCPGESVEINGETYTQSGTVIDTVPSVTAACDTIVTYTLVLLPQPAFTQTIEFCKGESVVVNGQTYTEPGVVLDTLPSVTGGCDTLATYILQYLTPQQPTAVTISCPQDIVVEADPGVTSVVVTFADATAASDCPCPGIDVQQSAGLLNGSAYPLGSSTVCYSAADSCGNTASCCFTITVNEAETACDTKVIGCMTYELIGISKDAAGDRTYRIRVTNNCASKLVYTAIQLPDGVTALDPANASTYTSPAGNAYAVRNPNFAPFYSIRFKPMQAGIANGASDVLEYTIPAWTNPTFIHVGSRLESQVFYEVHLNTFNCPVTTGQSSSRPLEERGSLFHYPANTLSVFPNPLSGGDLFANLSDWSGQTVQIRICDARGSEVLNQPFAASEQTAIHLPAGLAAGMYFLEAVPADGSRQSVKFVIEW